MNQIVFVKDGLVVCYLFGYSDCTISADIATILYSNESEIFDVTKNEDMFF